MKSISLCGCLGVAFLIAGVQSVQASDIVKGTVHLRLSQVTASYANGRDDTNTQAITRCANYFEKRYGQLAQTMTVHYRINLEYAYELATAKTEGGARYSLHPLGTTHSGEHEFASDNQASVTRILFDINTNDLSSQAQLMEPIQGHYGVNPSLNCHLSSV